jgi:uncharacterized protein YcaQ
MLRVPVTAARRLAVKAQGLDGPSPRRRPTHDEILDVARRIRCLQLDPTSIVARSHLLVVFSRLGSFDQAELERLVYEDRAMFEYWAHEASIVLVEDLPLHRLLMHHAVHGRFWHKRMQEWWDVNEAFRAYILDRLRADGPLPLREIEDRSAAPWLSSGWTHQRNVSGMLDLMWVRGHVGIAARDGGQRLWDLMERCLPPNAPQDDLEPHEITRRAALLALKALGIARLPHIRAHFTRGRYPGLPEVLKQLEAGGEIVPAEIDGLQGQWWVRADDVASLTSDDGFKPRTALLSPFDNLLCDRARTEELFGFSHRLEIYTPKAKRRWGFFVLPILRGDRLIGRADLAVDRKAGRLIAHALYREPDAPKGKGVGRAVRRELERLAAWQSVGDLEVRQAPDAWT